MRRSLISSFQISLAATCWALPLTLPSPALDVTLPAGMVRYAKLATRTRCFDVRARQMRSTGPRAWITTRGGGRTEIRQGVYLLGVQQLESQLSRQGEP